jgi:hypothetical protein
MTNVRSHCHTCRFAEWPVTASGRRNPKRPGRCTWEAKVRVPAAYSHDPENVLHLQARNAIWWDQPTTCPVFQRSA